MFSKIELHKGYHRIPRDPRDHPKMAIATQSVCRKRFSSKRSKRSKWAQNKAEYYTDSKSGDKRWKKCINKIKKKKLKIANKTKGVCSIFLTFFVVHFCVHIYVAMLNLRSFHHLPVGRDGFNVVFSFNSILFQIILIKIFKMNASFC